jgi:hypothetical protein
MKLKHSKLTTLALIIASTITVTAQTKIQYFSTFAKNGVTPAECKQASDVVVPFITEYHSPAWTWVIVCDEAAWKQFAVHIGAPDSDLTIMAETDLQGRMTFVRGYTALHPLNNRAESQPEHTVAHELGHILLSTTDEGKAEKKANELLKAASVALVASK